MMRSVLLAGAMLLAVSGGLSAQEAVIQSPITEEILPLEPLDPDDIGGFFETDPNFLAPVIDAPVAEAASIADAGVMLRAIDKVSGEVVDFDLAPGQTKQLGYIQVTLSECRFPTNNPSGDATAHLTVRNASNSDVAFAGWMIASSPALNALDHARYDVWVLRCITS